MKNLIKNFTNFIKDIHSQVDSKNNEFHRDKRQIENNKVSPKIQPINEDYYESLLLDDPSYQRRGEGKKKRNLLRIALEKDIKNLSNRQIMIFEQIDKERKENYEPLKFINPKGISPEDATRDWIDKENENYRKFYSEFTNEKITQLKKEEEEIRDKIYEKTKRKPKANSPKTNKKNDISGLPVSYQIKTPQRLYRGKRGGKYYLIRSKKGKIYRQYV